MATGRQMTGDTSKFELWEAAEAVLKRMREGDKHIFIDEGELLMLSQYVGEKEAWEKKHGRKIQWPPKAD